MAPMNADSPASETPPSAVADDALREVAVETERHVARAGWDQPVRLFALVDTRDLASRAPDLAPADAPEGALSAVEQEGFGGPDLQTSLARIAWPDAVLGCALAVERVVVPPEAQRDLPEDPRAALDALAAHPGRRDVRLLAAVHRDGRHVCLLRQRAHDDDDMVAVGPTLAAGLVEALGQSLRADAPDA